MSLRVAKHVIGIFGLSVRWVRIDFTIVSLPQS